MLVLVLDIFVMASKKIQEQRRIKIPFGQIPCFSLPVTDHVSHWLVNLLIFIADYYSGRLCKLVSFSSSVAT